MTLKFNGVTIATEVDNQSIGPTGGFGEEDAVQVITGLSRNFIEESERAVSRGHVTRTEVAAVWSKKKG